MEENNFGLNQNKQDSQNSQEQKEIFIPSEEMHSSNVAGGGNKKKIIIIALVIVLALAIIGGLIFAFLKIRNTSSEEEEVTVEVSQPAKITVFSYSNFSNSRASLVYPSDWFYSEQNQNVLIISSQLEVCSQNDPACFERVRQNSLQMIISGAVFELRYVPTIYNQVGLKEYIEQAYKDDLSSEFEFPAEKTVAGFSCYEFKKAFSTLSDSGRTLICQTQNGFKYEFSIISNNSDLYSDIFERMMNSLQLKEISLDPKQCEEKESFEEKVSCYSGLATETRDINICLALLDQQVKEECLTQYAQKLFSPRDCGKIETAETRGKCYLAIATSGGGIDICIQINDETDRNYCYLRYSIETSDKTLCDKISSDELKSSCVEGKI